MYNLESIEFEPNLLFSLSYNFDGLKILLTSIATNQKMMNDHLMEIDKRIYKTTDNIGTITDTLMNIELPQEYKEKISRISEESEREQLKNIINNTVNNDGHDNSNKDEYMNTNEINKTLSNRTNNNKVTSSRNKDNSLMKNNTDNVLNSRSSSKANYNLPSIKDQMISSKLQNNDFEKRITLLEKHIKEFRRFIPSLNESDSIGLSLFIKPLIVLALLF